MTKRQISIVLFSSFVVLSVIVGLCMPPRQNDNGRQPNRQPDRIVRGELAKELQATGEAEATAAADFLTRTTPTPDATATINYIYMHMDEFASPLATSTPTP